MGFGDKIKDEAFIKCGRHYCICHKFAGLKMELHHIKLKSEGGEDSADNCIPLCFDCHADMSSYDKKHPKGSKYTPNELKEHRDSWYSKFANPNLIAYSAKSIEIDVDLYKSIREKITLTDIDYILNQNFRHAFYKAIVHKITDYADRRISPDDQFIDPELEAYRAEFHSVCCKFTDLIAVNAFYVDGNDKLLSVPREWMHKNHEKFDQVTEEIHDEGKNLSKTYDALSAAAIRKLGVRIGY